LIKANYLEDALAVVKQGLFRRRTKGTSETPNLEEKVAYSPHLWSLYIDLERNIGTFDTIKAAYKKALDLKVITPFLLINYASFLEGKNIEKCFSFTNHDRA
jgi:pre-mRNA-splicing factor SYF1